jgi:tRNA (guanosine-2'-O-)-methyltransferase
MSDTTSDHLEQMLSPERLARLDAVLNCRLGGLTVLLEDLHKPQNMGACIRTLEALGIQNVHVVDGEDPFVPNGKITQGCHKWVDIHRHDDLPKAVAALRSSGHQILVGSPYADKSIEELDFSIPSVLCFGNELEGISWQLEEEADLCFRIPMFGYSRSFNISVALGICVHSAASARRLALGEAGDLSPEQKAQLRKQWLKLSRKHSEQIVAGLSTRVRDE